MEFLLEVISLNCLYSSTQSCSFCYGLVSINTYFR